MLSWQSPKCACLVITSGLCRFPACSWPRCSHDAERRFSSLEYGLFLGYSAPCAVCFVGVMVSRIVEWGWGGWDIVGGSSGFFGNMNSIGIEFMQKWRKVKIIKMPWGVLVPIALMVSSPFPINLGIICRPFWGSFAGRDHLRACTCRSSVLSLHQWRCYRNLKLLVSHTNVHAGCGRSWRNFLEQFWLGWFSPLWTYWSQVYWHNTSLVFL